MSKKFCALWWGVLIVLGVAVFQPSFNAPFVLDDVAKIQDNPDLRSPQPNVSIFFESYKPTDTHFRSDPSRPLTYVLYWSAWHIGGGKPWPFHVLNLVLHISAAFLLGKLFLSMVSAPPVWGMLASVLFLTLPLNSGTVSYAFGLSDILAGCLSLGVLLFVRTRKENLLNTVLLSTLFVMALLAKQSSIVLPALVVLVAWPKRKFQILMVSVAIKYLIVRWIVFGGVGDLEAQNTYAVLDYVRGQSLSLWKYLWMMLVPAGFTIDHAVKPQDIAVALALVSWTLWLSLCGFEFWVWWRAQFTAESGLKSQVSTEGKQTLSIGFLLFAIALAPTSTFMPTTDIFVERRAYFAAAGILLAVVYFLYRLYHQPVKVTRSIAVMAIATIVLAQTGISRARAEIYAHEEQLWMESLNLYPRNTRAAVDLSNAYLRKADFQNAKTVLEAITTNVPQEPDGWANLGALYFYPGGPFQDLNKADEYFLKALELEPTHVKTISNRGFLKMTQQNFIEGAKLFDQAIVLSPTTPLYLYGAGVAQFYQKNFSKSREFLERALKADPAYQPAKDQLQKIPSGH